MRAQSSESQSSESQSSGESVEAAPPAEPAEAPASAADPGSDDGGGTGLSLRWRARVMAGFEYEKERPVGAQTRQGDSVYEFVVRQARLGASGELADDFRVNVTFDVSDALSTDGGSASSPPFLRTAVLEYRPDRLFRLTVGRYKRPFSKLELTSAGDLPILSRGLWNDLAIEDNQWGDRAVGAMVSGRVKPAKVRWYLSLTNPAWSSQLAVRGVDVLGRFQIAPIKPLTLGINGGYKFAEIGLSDTAHSYSIGGDVSAELGALRVLLEGSYADLPFETGRPQGFGVLALVDYNIPLNADWALLPAVFGEIADADASVSQTESARLVFGVNVLAHGGFRIMPELALVRSLGDTSAANPWLSSETYRLIFSLAM